MRDFVGVLPDVVMLFVDPDPALRELFGALAPNSTDRFVSFTGVTLFVGILPFGLGLLYSILDREARIGRMSVQSVRQLMILASGFCAFSLIMPVTTRANLASLYMGLTITIERTTILVAGGRLGLVAGRRTSLSEARSTSPSAAAPGQGPP